MPNFKKAINSSLLGALTVQLNGTNGTEDTNIISGKINHCDVDFLYIKIDQGFQTLTKIHKNPGQFFNINFHINQLPYQLQLRALSFVKDHRLFDTLINNGLYAMTVNSLAEVPIHEYKLMSVY